MKTKVGILFGGRSVENEISVITALQVIQSMDMDKYDIIPIYIAKNGRWYSGDVLLEVSNYRNMDELLKKAVQVYMKPVYGDYNLYVSEPGFFGKKVVSPLDVVLPALHGTNCEDGTLQGVLAATGVPFVGCNVLASANGMDKITMKMILRECGIPTVDYFWFCDKRWYGDKDAVIADIENKLEYPVIVKPANSGSSVGIHTAHDRAELEDAVNDACSFTTRIIIERYVKQLKEVNCSVMGNYHDCIPSVCEIPMRSGEILSYTDKYCSSGTKNSEGMRSVVREIPAVLPDGVTEQIQQMAVDTFRALSCDGLSRIDFMIDEADGSVYVNEINTIPGSLSSYLWEYTGMTFNSVIDRLIDQAFARKREEGLKITDFGGNIFSVMKGSKGGKIGKFGKFAK